MNKTGNLTVVHLPYYEGNPYQKLLMEALADLGVKVIDGGGGGRFLKTLLVDWRPQVLHLHWLHPYILGHGAIHSMWRGIVFLVSMLVIRIWGCRVVWTIHNLHNHEGEHPMLERFFTRWGKLFFNRVVAMSQSGSSVARIYYAVSDQQLVLIPHHNYGQYYQNQVGRAEARQYLGIAGQADPVFLFLGRVVPYKGVISLIEVMKNLDDSLPGHLLIAGEFLDQEFEDQVTEAVGDSNRISLRAGTVPDDEIQYYFNACDLFVCPFRNILNSGSVVLAMAFGCPVLAPRLGSIPELLEGQDALLYDPGELESAIRAACQADRAVLKGFGESNRKKAAQWEVGAIARMHLDLYRDVIE